MTNLFLFEAMSEIDFDLIERAEAPVPLRKKPLFRVALIAASLALTLTVCSVSAGVAGTVAVGVQYEKYVAQNYPEYDGTLLHFAQILLTEDENVLSSLLDDDLKHALGGAIAALRQSLEGAGGDESTADYEQQTEDPELRTEEDEHRDDNGLDGKQTESTDTQVQTQTTKPEETTKAPVEDSTIFVHSSFDQLCMVAGEREIDVFHGDDYSKWRNKVEVTDPEVTHLKFRGWLAFAQSTPGTYGYSVDYGESVFDKSFSREPEDMVYVVSSYMGGQSCSRMEILIPIADLAPGEHKVMICVKSVKGYESNIVIFTLIMPGEQGGDRETESETTDEPPEDSWSKGLAYEEQTRNGEIVYVVSGIGSCKDKEIIIPPTYRGYPVVAIGKEAFFNVLIDFVSVPSTVKEIGEYAFFNCSVKRVELSEGVEVIGDSAFADAYYLEEINFPSTLKTIGSYAFCATDLTQVILPDSVTEVHGHAFTSCLHVTEIRLSANLTEIKAYMLEGVYNVKSIELPRGIERIGEWAFMQCSRLETVTLYHGVLQIDDNIFEYCEDIKEIRFVGTQAEWESIDMSKKTREQLTPLVVYVEE